MRNQSDNISIESQLEPKQNNSDFKCMSEVFEDGKLVHYLYNPNEKETLKAWKKSAECVK